MNTKICKKCELEKNISEFREQIRNDKCYFSGTCKKCDVENNKTRHSKFRELHKEELRKIGKNYREQNKDKIKENRKSEWCHTYYIKHKDAIQKKNQIRTKIRYKTDSNFRIRKTVSKAIYRALRLNGSSKRGNSCLFFLEYTVLQLKNILKNNLIRG